MKKYVITKKDKYLNKNELSSLMNDFKTIDEIYETNNTMVKNLQTKKIGEEAYLIRIQTKKEIEQYIPKIKEIVDFNGAKIYTTTDTYKELQRRYEASNGVAMA